MPRTPWTKQDIDLLRKVYPHFSNNEIQKKYFPTRTVESIKTQGIKKLKLSKNVVCQRTGSLEPLFLDTPEAFYWMGFIFADGSIINNQTRLSISLAKKDHNHLMKLALYLSTTTSLYIENGWCRKQAFCKLRIQDKQRALQLCKKFDLKPNKTYNPPVLDIADNNLFVAFFCGFIDGDGSITVNKNRKNCVNISIKVHGSWFNTLRYFEKRVYKALNYDEYNKVNRTNLNNKGYAVLRLSDNTLIRQLKHQAITLNLPLMNRKWDRIDTTLISKCELARQRQKEVKRLLDDGMYPAQISRKLGLKLTTTYGLVRQIKARTKTC